MGTDHQTRGYVCALSVKSSLSGLFIVLLSQACAAATDTTPEQVGLQTQAMIDGDAEKVNCNTCVGGDCALLRCFENWVQRGGGEEGPYTGPSGEPGGGSSDEPDEPTDGKIKCIVDCSADYYRCSEGCDDPDSPSSGEVCQEDCYAAVEVCFAVCEARFPGP